MQQPLVAGERLQRVTKRVDKIEYRPQPGFTLIARDHVSLYIARATHRV